jgi:hypothetical protein
LVNRFGKPEKIRMDCNTPQKSDQWLSWEKLIT